MIEIGVREFKRHLSAYLDRVGAGESIRITKRWKPVAEVSGVSGKPRSKMEQLIAEGRVTPASRPLHSVTLPAPVKFKTDPVGDLLREREEEETSERIMRESLERRGLA